MPELARRALAESDRPALAELITRGLQADGGLPGAAGEAIIRAQYLSGAGSGWFAADGTLLAAAGIGQPGQDGLVPAAGIVDPAHRGRELGRVVLDWAVSAAAGQPLLICSELVSESAERLYRRYGFRPVFAEQVLRADLGPDLRSAAVPVAGLPPGLELCQCQLAAGFFAAYAAAFRGRPGFPGWTQAEWLAWTSEDEDFAPALSWLALDKAGQAAGFVTVGANWIVQLGVVPAWRGRGLGGALLAVAMAGISLAGFDSCWLTVATNNPSAARLYRRAGFAEAGRRARYARGSEPGDVSPDVGTGKQNAADELPDRDSGTGE